MRMVFALICSVLIAAPAIAAEDYRVMKLEQDMRMLERLVQTLQRQLLDIQQQVRRSDPTIIIDDNRGATNDSEQKWLTAAAWNRIKTGMSELQVIEILGRPTALRPDASERRALLYTLEIGTTGFLTGTISFENGAVVEVQTPTLR
jgi:hypothetical protein